MSITIDTGEGRIWDLYYYICELLHFFLLFFFNGLNLEVIGIGLPT